MMLAPPKTTGTDGAFFRELCRRIEKLESDLHAARSGEAVLAAQIANLQNAITRFDENAALTDIVSISADATLSEDIHEQTLVYECTSACAITLPTPGEGFNAVVVNVGSSILTIKNQGGTAIVALGKYEKVSLCVLSEAGTMTWCRRPFKRGSNGYLFMDQPIVIEKNGSGIIFKGDEATAHWYRLTVVAGVLTLTDTGTTVFDGASTVVAS